MQQYLSNNGIEGAVINGKTGTNFSVKELKDFTHTTGLHLQDVQALQSNKSVLESLTEYEKHNTDLKQALTLTQDQLFEAQSTILAKEKELQIASDRIKTLETELAQTKSQVVELKSAKEEYGWGSNNSWGNNHSKAHEHEEETLW